MRDWTALCVFLAVAVAMGCEVDESDGGDVGEDDDGDVDSVNKHPKVATKFGTTLYGNFLACWMALI